MMDFLDWQYIKLKTTITQFIEDLKANEYGVSGIVAAVILVLVAVALAAIFWENIHELVTDWFSKISKDSGDLQKEISK